MSGLIGRKIGMTSIFDDSGNNIPCTVIEAGSNIVTQVKQTDGKDGYDAIQLGFGEKKAKRTSKALQGHFEKAGATPRRIVREFAWSGDPLALGDGLSVTDVFEEGERIDVAGISKGKGFQGVVRRHGFRGVGDSTHGQHNRARAPGSIGQSSDPSRVYKGMRMGGRMGNDRVTVKNLEVVRLYPDHNLILVKGAIPGPKNGFVELRKKK